MFKKNLFPLVMKRIPAVNCTQVPRQHIPFGITAASTVVNERLQHGCTVPRIEIVAVSPSISWSYYLKAFGKRFSMPPLKDAEGGPGVHAREEAGFTDFKPTNRCTANDI